MFSIIQNIIYNVILVDTTFTCRSVVNKGCHFSVIPIENNILNYRKYCQYLRLYLKGVNKVIKINLFCSYHNFPLIYIQSKPRNLEISQYFWGSRFPKNNTCDNAVNFHNLLHSNHLRMFLGQAWPKIHDFEYSFGPLRPIWMTNFQMNYIFFFGRTKWTIYQLDTKCKNLWIMATPKWTHACIRMHAPL